jgi:hypothetical protein
MGAVMAPGLRAKSSRYCPISTNTKMCRHALTELKCYEIHYAVPELFHADRQMSIEKWSKQRYILFISL